MKTYAKLLNVDIEDELNTVEQSLESVQRKKKSDLSIKQNPKVNFVYFILIFIFLLTLSYLVNVNDSTNVDNNFFFGTNNKKDLMMNKEIIS